MTSASLPLKCWTGMGILVRVFTRVVVGNVSQIGFSAHSSAPDMVPVVSILHVENSMLNELRRFEISVVPLKHGDKGDASPWMINTDRGESRVANIDKSQRAKNRNLSRLKTTKQYAALVYPVIFPV